MRTNQKVTFQALNTYQGFNDDGKYFDFRDLARDVMDFVSLDRDANKEQFNTDKTIKEVAYLELMYFLNDMIGSLGHYNYYVTYKQLRKYNQIYNKCIDKTIDVIVMYISQNRVFNLLMEMPDCDEILDEFMY